MLLSQWIGSAARRGCRGPRARVRPRGTERVSGNRGRVLFLRFTPRGGRTPAY